MKHLSSLSFIWETPIPATYPGAVGLLEISLWWDGEALPGLVCPGADTHKYRVGLVLPGMCHCSRSPAEAEEEELLPTSSGARQ